MNRKWIFLVPPTQLSKSKEGSKVSQNNNDFGKKVREENCVSSFAGGRRNWRRKKFVKPREREREREKFCQEAVTISNEEAHRAANPEDQQQQVLEVERRKGTPKHILSKP